MRRDGSGQHERTRKPIRVKGGVRPFAQKLTKQHVDKGANKMDEAVIKKVLASLSECANALIRQGGMLNMDIAKEATKAGSELKAAYEQSRR